MSVLPTVISRFRFVDQLCSATGQQCQLKHCLHVASDWMDISGCKEKPVAISLAVLYTF